MSKLPPYLKACASLLNELFSLKHEEYAWPFYKPVDEKCLSVKDYYDVIECPMDMTTIRKKLETLQYASFGEFTCDFRLIFSNCYKYNGVDSTFGAMGKKYEKVFDNCIRKYQHNASSSGTSATVTSTTATTVLEILVNLKTYPRLGY
ncbi:hypothetical protein GJ496_003889 [Pomphorhynchus laevis]|nr:hypothetical protein GJ496_003889 [Pomphorhynchus laevis]